MENAGELNMFGEPSVSSKRCTRSTRPDPYWEAVCQTFGLKPQTSSERSRVGKIVRDLKIKTDDPEYLEVQMQRHRHKWPYILPTPESVMKHWDQLKAEATLSAWKAVAKNKPRQW